MKILILSPFKTATTSLLVTFMDNNIPVIKLHGFDETFDTDYTHIFLVSRDKHKLYLSAFFQDIDNPEFEYYYGSQDDVLSASDDELINHYSKFDFTKYEHLNIEHYVDLINKYFNADINIDSDYSIDNTTGKYIIHIKLECLDKVFSEVCHLSGLPQLELQSHNSSTYKWYSQVYDRLCIKMNLK